MMASMPRFFALGLLAIGATVLVVSLRLSSRARETRGWARAEGRILASRVERVHHASEEQRHLTRFVVRYAYEARGRAYESEQLWIGSADASSSEDPAWSQRWVERFPVGAVVPVWYDPRDPAQAVLLRDLSVRHARIALLAGAALALLGFFFLARGR